MDAQLSALAAKLGVAVAYLWATMIRQAYVEGAVSLFWMATLAAVAVLAARLAKRRWAKGVEVGYSDEPEYLFPVIGLWTACGVCALGAAMNLDCALRALLNPQGWALQHILAAF